MKQRKGLAAGINLIVEGEERTEHSAHGFSCKKVRLHLRGAEFACRVACCCDEGCLVVSCRRMPESFWK